MGATQGTERGGSKSKIPVWLTSSSSSKIAEVQSRFLNRAPLACPIQRLPYTAVPPPSPPCSFFESRFPDKTRSVPLSAVPPETMLPSPEARKNWVV